MQSVEALLALPPYAAPDRSAFLLAMHDALRYHAAESEAFRRFLVSQGVDIIGERAVESFPFLPVGVFKEMELVTGDLAAIKKKIRSSATTGNKPSVICLDQTTIDRQRVALTKIMADIIGSERRPFLVLDAESTVKASGQEVSSRGSAIRGFLPFAKETHFLLQEDLTLRSDLSQLPDSILFGFTWVVYQVMQTLKKEGKKIKAAKLLHIGGWKKLRDLAVTKEAFNALAADVFDIPHAGVIDIYGMTEQLGTIYPDCPEGVKHVPIYSDVLVRNPADFSPQPEGASGLLQFLTPIPNSYPGISILTDDIGVVKGLDGCLCGRRGKYFIFQKRHEEAELKGCGDTL